jgi:hypothetical protein
VTAPVEGKQVLAGEAFVERMLCGLLGEFGEQGRVLAAVQQQVGEIELGAVPLLGQRGQDVVEPWGAQAAEWVPTPELEGLLEQGDRVVFSTQACPVQQPRGTDARRPPLRPR